MISGCVVGIARRLTTWRSCSSVVLGRSLFISRAGAGAHPRAAPALGARAGGADFRFSGTLLGCLNVKRAPARKFAILKCRLMQLTLRNDGRTYPNTRSAVYRCGRTNWGQFVHRQVSRTYSLRRNQGPRLLRSTPQHRPENPFDQARCRKLIQLAPSPRSACRFADTMSSRAFPYWIAYDRAP